MERWDQLLDPLMAQRYPALLAYANMLTAGDRAAAEDVVHDAIIRTFSRTRSFASLAHAENYTRRAILAVFLDGTRSRKRLIRAFARVATADAVPSSADAVDSAELIRGLLRELSPRERACIVLRYYDDMTIAQVADALGLATGTVKRYLANATARLGAVAGNFDDGPPARVPVTSQSRTTRKER